VLVVLETDRLQQMVRTQYFHQSHQLVVVEHKSKEMVFLVALVAGVLRQTVTLEHLAVRGLQTKVMRVETQRHLGPVKATVAVVVVREQQVQTQAPQRLEAMEVLALHLRLQGQA
jgi:hypothetical protein